MAVFSSMPRPCPSQTDTCLWTMPSVQSSTSTMCSESKIQNIHIHTPLEISFCLQNYSSCPRKLAVYELEWTGYMLLSSASVKLSADFLLRFLNSKWLIYSHNSCSLSVGSRLSYKATCLGSLILLWHWNAENVTHYYKRICTCNDFIKTRPMGWLDTKEARDHGRRHIWWLPA